MVFWRRDGKELYYLAADRGIMAVEIGTGSTRVRQADAVVPSCR